MGRAIILAALAALCLAVPASAAAPSLSVRAPSLSPTTVAPGGKASAKVALTNKSRRPVTAQVELLLSTDPKRGRGDARLVSRKVKLKRRGKAAPTIRFVVPRATATGSYHVIACVKKACKASRALAVRAGSTGAGGGPGGRGPGLAPAGEPSGDPGTFTPSGPFKPTLDAGRTASATIPVGGGTLEATAADGSRFVLTIPSGALLSPQDITMTPLAGADGLPYRDGLVAGVQFGPDGLQLLKPATLEIFPARPIPLDRQSPFAWNGDDDDLHNEPLDPDPSRIVMQILHFSGAGIAGGSFEDRLNQAQKQLDEQAADFRNKAAQELNEARARGGEIPFDRLAELMREYHKTVVAPNLTKALTDDSLFWLAARQVLDFEKTATLIALEGRLTREFAFDYTRMDDAILNYYNRAYDRCVNEENPEAGFEMFRALRQYDTAWLWDAVVFNRGRIRKCHRYALDVTGTITRRNPDQFSGYVQSVSVEAKGALMTLGELGLRESRTFVTPQITGATWVEDNEANECTHEYVGPGTAESPAYLHEFTFNFNLLGNGAPEVPEMRVDFNPGARRPVFHTTCTHEGDVLADYDETNPAWDFGWRFGHQEDYFFTLLEGWGFRARNWARVGQGGVWAHKVFKRTVQFDDGQSYTEDIELELRHVPQP